MGSRESWKRHCSFTNWYVFCIVIFLSNIFYIYIGDFSAVFSASGSAQAMAYAIDEVLEFRSADGSGTYKPGTDAIVSSVSYADVIWQPMTVTTTADGSKTTIAAISSDSAHNFTWVMAGQYAALANGAVLTPNSTKLDVTINYPYKAQDTNIAVRMVLLGASATGAASATVDFSQKQVAAGNTYISWIGKANTKLGLIDVTATASTDQTATYFDKNTNILSSLKAMASAGGNAQAYIKVH